MAGEVTEIPPGNSEGSRIRWISMMFGFACDETPELMPAPISYAHKLAKRLADVRKSGELKWLRPDGKSQVTVQYGPDGSVERIPAVVVSTQHSADVENRELREAIMLLWLVPVFVVSLGLRQ